MEEINTEEYKYFVPIPEECQKKAWPMMDWLYQFNDDAVILYHRYNKADGRWHTGPESTPVFAAFKNEEDAVAFKLRWT